MSGRRLVVAVTGERGIEYPVALLEAVRFLDVEAHLVLSRTSATAIRRRMGLTEHQLRLLADRVYAENNQAARISSGSFLTLGMVVMPCTHLSLASIALGMAGNLIHRAADVTMKEGRPLLIYLEDEADSPFLDGALARLSRVPRVTISSLTSTRPDETRVRAAIDDVLGRFGLIEALTRLDW